MDNISVFTSWWQTFQVGLVNKALQVVAAIVLFLIGRKVIGMIVKILDRMLERAGCEATVRSFARNAGRALCYIVLAVLLLSVLGFEVTSFAAAIASAGVALGLALQGSLSNLAGGILILLMHPFRVGDYIVTGSQGGTVKEIGLVYTAMLMPDGRTIIIPNGTLAGSTIENCTQQQKRRVEVQVGISYSADLRKAKEIFAQVIEELPQRLPDEPTEVFVAALADSAVTIEGHAWVASSDYLPALWAMNENVKLAFDREGVEIPFPQMDVHIRENGDVSPKENSPKEN